MNMQSKIWMIIKGGGGGGGVNWKNKNQGLTGYAFLGMGAGGRDWPMEFWGHPGSSLAGMKRKLDHGDNKTFHVSRGETGSERILKQLTHNVTHMLFL